MSSVKSNNTFSVKSKEKMLNDFLSINVNPNANKLVNHSGDLVNKFKHLNDNLKEIIQMEKDLKVKEMLTANKKVELLNLERRLKEKNTMKLDLQNVLECYLIILKNNEELLNRRIEDLRIKDTQLRQKEFIMNKIILANRGANVAAQPEGGEVNNRSALDNSVNLNELNKKASNEDFNKTKPANFSVIVNEEFCLESLMKKTWPLEENKIVSVTNESKFTIMNNQNNNPQVNNKQPTSVDKKKKINNPSENVNVPALVQQKKNAMLSGKDKDNLPGANVNKIKNKNTVKNVLNISHVADLTLEAKYQQIPNPKKTNNEITKPVVPITNNTKNISKLTNSDKDKKQDSVVDSNNKRQTIAGSTNTKKIEPVEITNNNDRKSIDSAIYIKGGDKKPLIKHKEVINNNHFGVIGSITENVDNKGSCNMPVKPAPVKSKPGRRSDPIEDQSITRTPEVPPKPEVDNNVITNEQVNKENSQETPEVLINQEVHYSINTNDKIMTNNFLESVMNTKPLNNEIIPNNYPSNYSTRHKKAKANNFVNDVFNNAESTYQRDKEDYYKPDSEIERDAFNDDNLATFDENQQHRELVDYIKQSYKHDLRKVSSSDEEGGTSFLFVKNISKTSQKFTTDELEDLRKESGLYDPAKSKNFFTPQEEDLDDNSSNRMFNNEPEDVLNVIPEEIQNYNRELSNTLVSKVLYKDIVTVFVDELIHSNYNKYLERLKEEQILQEEALNNLERAKKELAKGFLNNIFEIASDASKKKLQDIENEKQMNEIKKKKEDEERKRKRLAEEAERKRLLEQEAEKKRLKDEEEINRLAEEAEKKRLQEENDKKILETTGNQLNNTNDSTKKPLKKAKTQMSYNDKPEIKMKERNSTIEVERSKTRHNSAMNTHNNTFQFSSSIFGRKSDTSMYAYNRNTISLKENNNTLTVTSAADSRTFSGIIDRTSLLNIDQPEIINVNAKIIEEKDEENSQFVLSTDGKKLPSKSEGSKLKEPQVNESVSEKVIGSAEGGNRNVDEEVQSVNAGNIASVSLGTERTITSDYNMTEKNAVRAGKPDKPARSNTSSEGQIINDCKQTIGLGVETTNNQTSNGNLTNERHSIPSLHHNTDPAKTITVGNIDNYSFDSRTKLEDPQFFVPDDLEDSEDEDEDDNKMQTYMEYVKKMQDMAEETKKIENNMKQFANTINSMVGSTHNSNNQNVIS